MHPAYVLSNSFNPKVAQHCCVRVFVGAGSGAPTTPSSPIQCRRTNPPMLKGWPATCGRWSRRGASRAAHAASSRRKVSQGRAEQTSRRAATRSSYNLRPLCRVVFKARKNATVGRSLEKPPRRTAAQSTELSVSWKKRKQKS